MDPTKFLATMNTIEGMEFLIDKMKKHKTNVNFLILLIKRRPRQQDHLETVAALQMVGRFLHQCKSSINDSYKKESSFCLIQK